MAAGPITMFCSLQALGMSLRAREEPLTHVECALQGNHLPAAFLGQGLAVRDGVAVAGTLGGWGAPKGELWNIDWGEGQVFPDVNGSLGARVPAPVNPSHPFLSLCCPCRPSLLHSPSRFPMMGQVGGPLAGFLHPWTLTTADDSSPPSCSLPIIAQLTTVAAIPPCSPMLATGCPVLMLELLYFTSFS